MIKLFTCAIVDELTDGIATDETTRQRTPDYRENTLIPRREFLSGHHFEILSGLHLAENFSPRFVRTWVSSCFSAKFCPDWLIWPNFCPKSRLGILEVVGHVVEFVCVHRSESEY